LREHPVLMVRRRASAVSNHEIVAILRDASRSLSSGAHSRDPLAMLLRMRTL
jgi:hypothetical protein